MLSVGLPEDDVQPHLNNLEDVGIACVNSPSNVTLSGNRLALAKLEKHLQSENIFARRLKVEVAYHSPDMRVIADEYLDSIKDIQILPTKSTPVMFSTVTGALVASSELDASYWIRNLVSPVQFSKALGTMFPASSSGRRPQHDGLPLDTILEIGPHSALQGPLRQILAKNGRTNGVDYASVLIRGKNAVVSSLEALGSLWIKGQSLNFSHINQLEADSEPIRPLTNLPNYPWEYVFSPPPLSAQLTNRYVVTPTDIGMKALVSDITDLNRHHVLICLELQSRIGIPSSLDGGTSLDYRKIHGSPTTRFRVQFSFRLHQWCAPFLKRLDSLLTRPEKSKVSNFEIFS